MRIYVDIDNTICQTAGNEYRNAVPIHGNITKINKLFEDGHEITYWTARGGTSGIDWEIDTLTQLSEWGCLYDYLKMGKPSFDLLIDDKCKRIEEL